MHSPSSKPFVVAVVPLILTLAALAGWLAPWQKRVTDALFTTHQASPNIVIVAIDEASIREIGQWPWPRAVFGSLVDRLRGAAIIGIDVNFKEQSRLGAADDQTFAAAIKRSTVPVVITEELLENGTVSAPIAPLQAVAQRGFANLTQDSDGVIRSATFKTGPHTSFATTIALRHAPSVAEALPDNVPLIAYAGPANSFTMLPARDVLSGELPANLWQDKIVLVGATVRDLQDFHATPLGVISGVEIQANIIASILSRSFFRTSSTVTLAVIWVAALIAWLAVSRSATAWKSIGIVAGAFLAYALLIFMMFERLVSLDLLYPTLSLAGTTFVSLTVRYRAVQQERQFIRATFSRYLAPEIIQELLDDPSKIDLGGRRAELTIMFSDVRGFTTLSEGMQPDELANFLNRYLTRMSDLIMDNRGVIDKYIGDAIMAFWGAPLENKAHALSATLSALAMVDALAEFNAENIQRGEPAIDIGIGLNSGTVTVGNMGSRQRFDYTIMGDAVNLASRLEGLTKMYGVHILASEQTVKLLADNPEIVVREVDQVKVKGKTQGIRIFQIVPLTLQAQRRATQKDYSAALEHYYAGRWAEAIAGFDRALAINPDDKPAANIRARCLELQSHPPENWDGIYEMKSK